MPNGPQRAVPFKGCATSRPHTDSHFGCYAKLDEPLHEVITAPRPGVAQVGVGQRVDKARTAHAVPRSILPLRHNDPVRRGFVLAIRHLLQHVADIHNHGARASAGPRPTTTTQ